MGQISATFGSNMNGALPDPSKPETHSLPGGVKRDLVIPSRQIFDRWKQSIGETDSALPPRPIAIASGDESTPRQLDAAAIYEGRKLVLIPPEPGGFTLDEHFPRDGLDAPLVAEGYAKVSSEVCCRIPLAFVLMRWSVLMSSKVSSSQKRL